MCSSLEQKLAVFNFKYYLNCKLLEIPSIKLKKFPSLFVLVIRMGDKFCKVFYCIYWDDHMVLFNFTVNYTDFFQHCDILLR